MNAKSKWDLDKTVKIYQLSKSKKRFHDIFYLMMSETDIIVEVKSSRY